MVAILKCSRNFGEGRGFFLYYYYYYWHFWRVFYFLKVFFTLCTSWISSRNFILDTYLYKKQNRKYKDGYFKRTDAEKSEALMRIYLSRSIYIYYECRRQRADELQECSRGLWSKLTEPAKRRKNMLGCKRKKSENGIWKMHGNG